MIGQTASHHRITHERLLVHVNVSPLVPRASSETHNSGSIGKFAARGALPNRLLTVVAPTRNRLLSNPFTVLWKARRRTL